MDAFLQYDSKEVGVRELATHGPTLLVIYNAVVMETGLADFSLEQTFPTACRRREIGAAIGWTVNG